MNINIKHTDAEGCKLIHNVNRLPSKKESRENEKMRIA